MRVCLDEPGRNHETVGVDLFATRPIDFTHCDDAVADHGDIAPHRRRAGTIDYNAVTDDGITVGIHAVGL